MTPIINSSFNKHPMPWEIIHHRPLHPYYSAMKAMCRHQTLDGLPKQFPKKIHKSPCIIWYTEKWQLPTRAQQLTPVNFNQDNFFTWTLDFTTSIPSVDSLPCSQYSVKRLEFHGYYQLHPKYPLPKSSASSWKHFWTKNNHAKV